MAHPMQPLFDQFDDLRDMYSLGQISRDEFVKRLTDITEDFKEACTEARMTDQANERTRHG